jgi:hypothetical protein
MMHGPRPQPSGATSNASDLRKAFVQWVHQLVQLGYERLTPADHANEEEPAITGFLVEAIDNVLSDRAKPWMTRFSVHDDPPVNDGRRKGKQRKRVDLRIDSGHFRPRARFRFEAKRLGKRHPVTIYLGAEGLGCFLRGDYAREEDEAGMLGYVQFGDLEDWGGKIRDELAKTPNSYAVDPEVAFSPHTITSSELLKTYRSQHNRSTVGRSIGIIHTLLMFL